MRINSIETGQQNNKPKLHFGMALRSFLPEVQARLVKDGHFDKDLAETIKKVKIEQSKNKTCDILPQIKEINDKDGVRIGFVVSVINKKTKEVLAEFNEIWSDSMKGFSEPLEKASNTANIVDAMSYKFGFMQKLKKFLHF